MSDTQNDQLVLISGGSSTGKTMSLRNIRNKDKWFYLNCEGKRKSFAPPKGEKDFQEYRITDPYQVHEGLDAAQDDSVGGVIIDTLTYLMNQVENQYVLTSSNTMKA